MAKYKVVYTGFVYVEADSPDEAAEKAESGETVYEEQEFEEPVEIDEFTFDISEDVLL